MRVVMVGDYPRSPDRIEGGVQAVIRYLLESMESYADITLEVVALAGKGGRKRTERHGAVDVHYLPSCGMPSRLSFWGNVRRVRDEIRRLKPDLVHAHIAGLFAEAASQSGAPWVLTQHGIRFLEATVRPGFLNRTYRRWFIQNEEARSIRNASHLISISPFVQATLAKHIRGKVFDIDNPVPEAFFKLPPIAQPGRLLYAGRLIPRKRVHTLLEAFVHAHRQMPSLTLRLAGGGAKGKEPVSYEDRLKEIVAREKLESAVTFLGEVNEQRILEEYSACSAVALASELETAPMVTLQAMAAARPVVTTDAGGARWLVEDGKSGLIVPKGDPVRFGEAIFELFKDEDRLRAMGARGQEIAEARFRGSVVAARTREVYYDVLGKPVPALNTHEPPT